MSCSGITFTIIFHPCSNILNQSLWPVNMTWINSSFPNFINVLYDWIPLNVYSMKLFYHVLRFDPHCWSQSMVKALYGISEYILDHEISKLYYTMMNIVDLCTDDRRRYRRTIADKCNMAALASPWCVIKYYWMESGGVSMESNRKMSLGINSPWLSDIISMG